MADTYKLQYDGMTLTYPGWNGCVSYEAQSFKTLTLLNSEGGTLTANTLTGYPGDTINLTTAYNTYWRFSVMIIHLVLKMLLFVLVLSQMLSLLVVDGKKVLMLFVQVTVTMFQQQNIFLKNLLFMVLILVIYLLVGIQLQIDGILQMLVLIKLL